MFKVTRESIMGVLKHDQWLTGFEILEELKSSASGSLYVHLMYLEDDKLVESRWRDQSEKEKDRNPHRRMEYRLTQDGVQARYEGRKNTPLEVRDPLSEPSRSSPSKTISITLVHNAYPPALKLNL